MVGGRGGGVWMSLHSQALPFWHTANLTYTHRRSSGTFGKDYLPNLALSESWQIPNRCRCHRLGRLPVYPTRFGLTRALPGILHILLWILGTCQHPMEQTGSWNLPTDYLNWLSRSLPI